MAHKTLSYIKSIHKYFKRITNTDYVLEWKSKEVSDESIEPPSAPINFRNPSLNYFGDKLRVKFSGSCLKQGKTTYNHGKMVNIYTAYETSKNYNISSYPTLENVLFGAVCLTTHVDIDTYKYFGNGIGSDRKGFFFRVVELVQM